MSPKFSKKHRPEGHLQLIHLRRGQRRRVTRLEEEKAALIASFGIYPGVLIEMKQRRPIYVLRCEDSEIAMDEHLAQGIWVEEE